MSPPPTTGRIVRFWPAKKGEDICPPPPWAAIVTLVHEDLSVDLCVFHPLTGPSVRVSVPLWREGPRPAELFAEWGYLP